MQDYAFQSRRPFSAECPQHQIRTSWKLSEIYLNDVDEDCPTVPCSATCCTEAESTVSSHATRTRSTAASLTRGTYIISLIESVRRKHAQHFERISFVSQFI